jgi:UDP-N-acetylmuramoyl-tripeptide--D-alanyl-D-alanine ligase
LAAGAAVAVVSATRRIAPESVGGPLLVVEDDPLDALERLGRAARARTNARIVAVTGSVGKTSTKEMLRCALEAVGLTHAPVGSFNNHWGVPLTLARMPQDARFGVFEIGMNHAGEIRPLAGMVRPHVALITTVEPVHIEYFASVRDIAEAKAEILEGVEPGGTAVLNRDNPWFDLLSERAWSHGARIVSFGRHAAADVRLAEWRSGPESEIVASVSGRPLRYTLGAPGEHMAMNSLGVLAAADALGADLAAVAEALASFRAPKGRGERVRLSHRDGPFTLIDESYNANPASMRAAIALLGEAAPGGQGRRIAVLGDMLELGREAETRHQELLSPLTAAGADLVYLAGPQMHTLWEVLPDRVRGAYATSAGELEPILVEAVRPGDVVMVKASAGTRLGPVVEALKARFSAAGASRI